MARNSSLPYHMLYLVVGVLYPAYASLRAIETPTKSDDTVWLMYWIVFALFSLIEFFSDYLFEWLPIYSSLKVAFLLWCTLPIPHNGAYYLFKVFVQPFFAFYGKGLDPYFIDVLEMVRNIIPPYPPANQVYNTR